MHHQDETLKKIWLEKQQFEFSHRVANRGEVPVGENNFFKDIDHIKEFYMLQGKIYKTLLHVVELNIDDLKNIVEYCLIYGYVCNIFTRSWFTGKEMVIELIKIKDALKEVELGVEKHTLLEA